MNKKQTLILIASFLTLATIARAQESNVVLPVFDDTYAKYVRQLENGDLNINFTDLRNSFLESW